MNDPVEPSPEQAAQIFMRQQADALANAVADAVHPFAGGMVEFVLILDTQPSNPDGALVLHNLPRGKSSPERQVQAMIWLSGVVTRTLQQMFPNGIPVAAAQAEQILTTNRGPRPANRRARRAHLFKKGGGFHDRG